MLNSAQAKSGGSVYAFSVGKLSEVKVLVPKTFEEKAKELIKPEESASGG